MAAVTSSQSTRILLTVAMAGLAALMLILNALPFAPAAAMRWVPSLPLVLIFFWAVHRPEIFPRWLAFAVGLAQDVLSGGPLGLWALVYTCVYEGAFANRVFFIGRAAYSSWLGFCAAAAVTGVLSWAVASLYFWQAMPLLPVGGQMMVTVAVYPVVAGILSMIDRALGGES